MNSNRSEKTSIAVWPKVSTVGIQLHEKLQTTELLLRAGANIDELNTVRKHLSRLKGGQLGLRARSATVVTLVLSDVVGDRLDVIGSGPTRGRGRSTTD
jgi:glycerate-2-kinase